VVTIDVSAKNLEAATYLVTQIEEAMKITLEDMQDGPLVRVFLPGNNIVRICVGMDDDDGLGFDEDIFTGPVGEFFANFSSKVEWGLNLESLTQNLETVTARELLAVKGVTRLGDITALVDGKRSEIKGMVNELKENLDGKTIPFLSQIDENPNLPEEMSESLKEMLELGGQRAAPQLREEVQQTLENLSFSDSTSLPPGLVISPEISNALDIPIIRLLPLFYSDLTNKKLRFFLLGLRSCAFSIDELKSVHIRNAEGKGFTANITNFGSASQLVALLEKVMLKLDEIGELGALTRSILRDLVRQAQF
jgi:hypothetical protein